MNKVLFASALLAAASGAQASLIPTLRDGAPADLGSSVFAYSYDATLASDAGLQTGNFFTIYDFANFFGVSGTPANFTFSTANVGVTPGNVVPDDDPALINITFTYTGPDLNYDQNSANNSELNFSPFVIRSRSDIAGLDSFTSLTVKNDGPARGTPIGTVGQVEVPLLSGGSGSFVPEPASWAMLVAGFGIVGGSMRRRRPTVAA